MNFQENKLGGFTLQSDLFKDFWFLKCQLVSKIVGNFFRIKSEHLKYLPKIDNPINPPRGSYGKLQNPNVQYNYSQLWLQIEFNEDGLCFSTDFEINMDTGVIDLYFTFSHFNKKSYKDPPELDEYYKKWLKKELASVNYNMVSIQRDITFDILEILQNRYMKNFENWLEYLSKLRRVPDKNIPPCSEGCPHKFKLFAGAAVCNHRLYKVPD